MRKTFGLLFLVILVAPTAGGQDRPIVVVAPPPPTYIDFTNVGDPYGACLSFGPQGCVPNPWFRPDYTIGIYDPAAIGRQQAAATENTEIRAALEDVTTKLAAFEAARAAEQARTTGVQLQTAAAQDKLAAVLKAQQDLALRYRQMWPTWERHWRAVAPTMLREFVRLRNTVALEAVRSCSQYSGFFQELRVALPPAPDEQLVEIHRTLYELNAHCSARELQIEIIIAASDAAANAVRRIDDWAAGRSAYYATK